MGVRLLLIFISLLSYTIHYSASTEKRFISSPEIMAMGGAGVACANKFSAIYMNPASFGCSDNA